MLCFKLLEVNVFLRGAMTKEMKPRLWRDRVVAISISLHFFWSVHSLEEGRGSRNTVQWSTSAPNQRKKERESLVTAHPLLHSFLLAASCTPFMQVVKTNSIVALPPVRCLLSLQLRLVVESVRAPASPVWLPTELSPAALVLPGVAVNS